MSDLLLQRLSQVPVLPQFQAALSDLVTQDWNKDSPALHEQDSVYAALGSIFEVLSGNTQKTIEPFLVAWYTLRAAVLRLDHIQDNDDNLDNVLSAASHAQLYNLVLASYVLATTMLDEIDEQIILSRRTRQLRRLWNDSVLEAASGQQTDLSGRELSISPHLILELYEETIKAKAGSIYRIGFGGVAILASDDDAIIKILSRVGEIFGTLLQLNDDLLDANTETELALTLSQSYDAARLASGLDLPTHTVGQYARHVYQAYLDHVRSLLIPLPVEIQAVLIPLFHQVFGSGDEAVNST